MTRDDPASEPFETAGGEIGWLALKSVCLSGRTVPLPPELRTDHPRSVERGYVVTGFPGYTNPGTLVWSVGGAVRAYPGLRVAGVNGSIDADGEPVGILSASLSVPGYPYRGHRRFPLQKGAQPVTSRESRVLAARRERVYAGAIRLGPKRASLRQAVLWRDPEATPEPLPTPKPFTEATVGAVNDRGDVAGVLTRPGGDPSGVLWRDGRPILIPLSRSGRISAKGKAHRLVWTNPLAVTDDGLVVLTETETPGGGFHPMLWDGSRVESLANLVRGRTLDISAHALFVAGNGRDLYALGNETGAHGPANLYRLKRLR